MGVVFASAGALGALFTENAKLFYNLLGLMLAGVLLSGFLGRTWA